MRRKPVSFFNHNLSLAAAVTCGIGSFGLLTNGCSSQSNEVAPVSFETLAPTGATSTSGPAPTPTTSATTSAAPTTAFEATTTLFPLFPTTSLGAGPEITGPMFSDSLGVKVDTAPGVHSRGDTRKLLDQGLWVHIAWEADPQDFSVYTAYPDDIEILEAYTRATLAYYRGALGLTPTTDPDFDLYMINGSTRFNEAFEERSAAGTILSLGSGVLLRPYVLGDQRSETTAVVFDCVLLDEQEISLASASPTLGEFRPYPVVATMIKTSDGWKIDRLGSEPGVCN